MQQKVTGNRVCDPDRAGFGEMGFVVEVQGVVGEERDQIEAFQVVGGAKSSGRLIAPHTPAVGRQGGRGRDAPGELVRIRVL